jgi:hypothetical protein
MKAISLHVAVHTYQEFQSIAARTNRSVADLIREAMAQYVAARRRTGRAFLDSPPHASGRLRRKWTRSEIMDEMIGR